MKRTAKKMILLEYYSIKIVFSLTALFKELSIMKKIGLICFWLFVCIPFNLLSSQPNDSNKRTVIQVAAIIFKNGTLDVIRDEPFDFWLP